MKSLEISLSDFKVSKESLLTNFAFEEVKYNFFIDEKSNSFYRKLSLEQGFEVIVFSLKYLDSLALYQVNSENGFYAKYFILEETEDGSYLDEFVQFNNNSQKKIHETSIKKNTKGIVFIFNERWLETRFQKTTIDLFLHKILTQKIDKAIKHNIKGKFEKIKQSVRTDDPNTFFLKLKLYALFQYCFEEILQIDSN